MIFCGTLSTNVLNGFLDFLVRDPATLGAIWLLTTKLNQHIAFTQQLLCTLLVQNNTGVQRVINRKCNAVIDVCADQTSYNVSRRTLCCNNQVNTCSTTKLSNTDNGRLNVFARNHHKVSKLVDDNNKVWHVLWRVLHISVFIAINVSVVRLNVTNLVVLKYLQAALHLGDAPLKRTCCLPWLGNNWNIQVRKTSVTRKLNALWVNHNKANLLRSCAHEHRHDNSVEQDRLTRTGSTCYQQVRKAGKVNNNWLTLRIATKGTLKRTTLCKR